MSLRDEFVISILSETTTHYVIGLGRRLVLIIAGRDPPLLPITAEAKILLSKIISNSTSPLVFGHFLIHTRLVTICPK